MAHKSNKFEHPNQMMPVVEINAVVPGKINTLHVTVENNGNDVTSHKSQRIIKSPAHVS